MPHTLRYILCCIFFTLAGCASSSSTPDIGNIVPATLTAQEELVMYGDSITHGYGQMAEEYLPGWKVVNNGVDGQMASHIGGTLPTFDKTKTYVFSFGANECEHNIPLADYWKSLNHLMHYAQGNRVILEAPWRITDSSYGCDLRVDDYRQVVVDIVNEYRARGERYISLTEDNQESSTDNLHLLEPHNRIRVKLIAGVALALSRGSR